MPDSGAEGYPFHDKSCATIPELLHATIPEEQEHYTWLVASDIYIYILELQLAMLPSWGAGGLSPYAIEIKFLAESRPK